MAISLTFFSLSQLTPLINALQEEADLVGTLCYGSRGQKMEDEKSDVDLLNICRGELPSAEKRKKIYQNQGCEQIRLGRSFDNWDTPWTPLNDEFYFQGTKVEIGYNVSTWVDVVVQQVYQHGQLTLPEFEFRSYTFLGLLENSICLYEKEGYITKLRKAIKPFSQKLKHNIIEREYSVLNESLVDLENNNQRNIGVLAFQFYLFRALDAAIQILFAVNEIYYPASKREEQHLMRLQKLPPALRGLITDILPSFYNQREEVISAMQEIKSFIDQERRILV